MIVRNNPNVNKAIGKLVDAEIKKVGEELNYSKYRLVLYPCHS
jgi:hypothetical protein